MSDIGMFLVNKPSDCFFLSLEKNKFESFLSGFNSFRMAQNRYTTVKSSSLKSFEEDGL